MARNVWLGEAVASPTKKIIATVNHTSEAVEVR
jgi:hypothetical protein